MKKLLIVAALLAGSAHAEFYSGNDLLAKLQSSEPVERMIGAGYITGVFDAASGASQCPPENVTIGQVRDMVKSHLEATPTLRHYPADVQVRFVLTRAWPCAKKGTAL